MILEICLYVLYVAVGYYASRLCIDKLEEPMPLLLFIGVVLFIWPVLVVAALTIDNFISPR